MKRDIVILVPTHRKGWFWYNYCLTEEQLRQMSPSSSIGIFMSWGEIQFLDSPRYLIPRISSRKRTATTISDTKDLTPDVELIVILPKRMTELEALHNASIEELLAT